MIFGISCLELPFHFINLLVLPLDLLDSNKLKFRAGAVSQSETRTCKHLHDLRKKN